MANRRVSAECTIHFKGMASKLGWLLYVSNYFCETKVICPSPNKIRLLFSITLCVFSRQKRVKCSQIHTLNCRSILCSYFYNTDILKRCIHIVVTNMYRHHEAHHTLYSMQQHQAILKRGPKNWSWPICWNLSSGDVSRRIQLTVKRVHCSSLSSYGAHAGYRVCSIDYRLLIICLSTDANVTSVFTIQLRFQLNLLFSSFSYS